MPARNGCPPTIPKDRSRRLRQFQKVAVFCVAFADFTERLPLMKVSDRLTDIAELIIECCMRLAWDQMTQMYGTPRCKDADGEPREVRVAVAGYGKLGGLELGYGSDLDLVFLHDSSGEAQQTSGERPLDNVVFFLRLGQRIVHLLTMHSAAGRLYEVDMRLRPNGKGGLSHDRHRRVRTLPASRCVDLGASGLAARPEPSRAIPGFAAVSKRRGGGC